MLNVLRRLWYVVCKVVLWHHVLTPVQAGIADTETRPFVIDPLVSNES
jgi:hypothetical protein